MNQLWQFGSKSEEEINAEIEENISNNTKKTRESILLLPILKAAFIC
jgi:hypothetical protein